MMVQESVDTLRRDGLAVGQLAPGAWHPECGAIPGTSHLIRIENDAAEAKARRGRRWPKPASVVVSAGGARWYCAEVAPRMERLAACEIQALGLPVLVAEYLGRQRMRERVGGVVRVVERPALLLAFPRFVFVEADVREPAWRRIATRRGVKRLLGGEAERPQAVPAEEMAWVISQFGEDGVQRRVPDAAGPEPLAVGRMVRVVAGPLAGHESRVVRSNGRTVWIEWAGRRVSMAQAAVKVVGPP